MRQLAALALSLAVAIVIRAQSTSASVAGRITDPSKALIAAATVTAVSTGTNFRYETTSSPSGEYVLPNLPPGLYRIEVQKDGFNKLLNPDLVLHVQDALNLDFELTLGPSSESVTVQGGAPSVDTQSAEVSTLIDGAFIENLPLNGRSFQTLMMLTPGLVTTATVFSDQGQFSVNGQRADANYFTVDGVSANFGVTGYLVMVQTASGSLPALSASGATNSLVSVDAMQEFRIQTSSFAPEFGRMPGGQISIATRSGTNAFHATVFEYLRNDLLDARDWFVNFNGLAKPQERQNDFGGVLGGPIVKNRTFFFISYEGQRLRQPVTQQSVVPDVTSRQQAPAGMRPFLDAFPIPNGPVLGAGTAQFTAGYSNPSMLDAGSARVDQAVNSRLTIFGRYNYSPSSLDQRAPPVAGPVLSLTQPLSVSVHTATVGLTQLIAPEIVNEVRANYSNDRVGTRYVLDNFGGAVPLPDSLLFPQGTSSATGLFALYIPGLGLYDQGKLGANEQRQVNFIENLSMARKGHQWKFGVDYRWLAPFVSPYSYRQFAQFSGMAATPGGALSGVASIAQTNAYESNALLSQNFSVYGQDTWRIGPKVTVTYGLRWDVNPPLKGKNPANDPFTVTGLTSPAAISLAPRGTPLYETGRGNIAPRLGVAWQLRGTAGWGTTIRAGAGLFYDVGQGSLGGVSSYFPYFSSKTIPSAPFPLSPQDLAPPSLSLNPPVSTILVADPHLKLPRTYQWNIALEQSLGKTQSLSLTYIGAVGRDLLRATSVYNPNPDFQFVSVTDNSATSDYHALQAKFQRPFARGLQVVASYTFSHSIDNASTDAFTNYLNTPGTFANPNLDRGNSDFDVRHASSAGVTYNLPYAGRDKIVRALLGGWSLNAFVLARTAPPVNVVGGISFAGGTALYPRPNLNAGVPVELDGSGYPGGKIFNRLAFAPAGSGQQGSFGRNVLRGFGAAQADIGFQRVFRIVEQTQLRFRAELFNILNHPNFGAPNNNLTSALFGRSTQTLANSLGSGGANGGLNPLYQIGGPRSAQLALKLIF